MKQRCTYHCPDCGKRCTLPEGHEGWHTHTTKLGHTLGWFTHDPAP